MLAASTGSTNTGLLIISKSPKKVVIQNMEAIKIGSQALVQAAKKRVGV